VQVDCGFFGELQIKFDAECGDFAIAFALAHEIGRHFQTSLETS
jgi:predicted metalloprotease